MSEQLQAVREKADAVGVLEAMRNRRSIGRVKPDPVDREVIEAILDAASWAPSHFNTQPWRFVVMTGEGRAKLGEGYARVSAAQAPADMGAEELEERLRKARNNAFRSPVVIAAICSPSDDPRAMRAEELAAAQIAVQNVLLAAHAYGLGAIWRSGQPMFDPLMKEQFELRPDEELVAFVYVGHPDMTPAAPQREPIMSKTIWLEG